MWMEMVVVVVRTVLIRLLHVSIHIGCALIVRINSSATAGARVDASRHSPLQCLWPMSNELTCVSVEGIKRQSIVSYSALSDGDALITVPEYGDEQ